MLRGEHTYPPEWGDVGPLHQHVAHIARSMRGVGFLASALGPASAPAVCQQLCRPLSSTDWHDRMLIAWFEAVMDNRAPAAVSQRSEGMPPRMQKHAERTGLRGLPSESGEVVRAVRARESGRRHPEHVRHGGGAAASTSAVRGQRVWSMGLFHDLYPDDGLRAHETLREMVGQDGTGNALLLQYCALAVRAEMRRVLCGAVPAARAGRHHLPASAARGCADQCLMFVVRGMCASASAPARTGVAE